LNVFTVKNGDIEVTKYETSEITTSHAFIQIQKGDSIKTVLETDSYGFADIIISKDTVIIKYLPTVVYRFTDSAFKYKIVLDTSISIDYWRQKVVERERNKN
jgi:hypothetical protein